MGRTRTLLGLTLVMVGILLLATSCDKSDPVKAAPTASVFVGGDSLTVQTAITEGALPVGWDVVSGLGWQAENIQPTLAQRVADSARSPGRVVFALGQNDAGYAGWTTTDQLQVIQLATTPHPAACVAWVLPWYTGPDLTRAAAIDRYRTWVTTWAADHGQPVVDWRPEATAHPGDIDVDGIHLSSAGRLAYGALIQEAVADCA